MSSGRWRLPASVIFRPSCVCDAASSLFQLQGLQPGKVAVAVAARAYAIVWPGNNRGIQRQVQFRKLLSLQRAVSVVAEHYGQSDTVRTEWEVFPERNICLSQPALEDLKGRCCADSGSNGRQGFCNSGLDLLKGGLDHPPPSTWRSTNTRICVCGPFTLSLSPTPPGLKYSPNQSHLLLHSFS